MSLRAVSGPGVDPGSSARESIGSKHAAGVGGLLPRVFLVDDDATFRRAMAKALGRKGLQVAELSGGMAAISALLDEGCLADVMILDLQMPEVSGMQVLRQTPRRRPKTIVLTGHGTIPEAVEAMRLGAFSFLQKPLDADELLPVIHQALASELRGREQLVGDSAVMRSLREVLCNFAQANDPVLLYGETGTGKEVAARYMHQCSRRAGLPMVAINLACLPRELCESELFGHAKGAFTGADRRKRGLFAEAGQGTLFLDEVSELPIELQPKLLRALEMRTFRPVGELKEEPLQANLICATNRDLRSLVRQGKFREDLYYRLAVLPVVLPPLREHADDIGQIAEHWLQKVAQSSPLHAESGLKLTSDAHAALARHDYPGNVRELVNVIRRVSLFAQGGVVDGELVRRMLAEDPFRTLRPQAFTGPLGTIESQSPQAETSEQQLTNGELSGPESRRLGATQHFPTSSLASQSRPLLVSVAAGAPLSLRELEIRHIEQLLREHKNITMVAKLLDIDRRTLQRKLRGLGIEWRDE